LFQDQDYFFVLEAPQDQDFGLKATFTVILINTTKKYSFSAFASLANAANDKQGQES